MKKAILTILLALIVSVNYALQPETFIISEDVEGADYYSIAQNAWILEDEEHEISFEDILNNTDRYSGKFTKIEQEVTNLDFTTSAYWIIFKLKNITKSKKRFLMEVARPLTNIVNLYIVDESGNVTVKKSGDEIPFHERDFEHRKLFFNIELEPNREISYYLYLVSDGEVITLPIKLWSPDSLQKRDYWEQYILGFYYGMLMFVIIIFFFFYTALREKSFLYYILYVLALFFLQLSIDGLAYEYLWPNYVWLGNHAIGLSACIAMFFVLKYAQSFLKIQEILPKLNIVFKVFLYLIIITFGIAFTKGTLYAINFPVINIIALITDLLILLAILIAIRKKHKVDLYFALAFVFLIIGIVIFILGNFNVIPNSNITEYGIKMGSALEVIFLSISMSNRYRSIQKEKEVAQQIVLEKLEEMNKLKEDINIELEKQVKERTKEINQQKEELAEKNKDITDSIIYAQRIQSAILPTDEQIKEFLTESFVLFKPKDIVSGDFYWFAAKKKKIFIAACDCTGHGVPGAFVSMIGNDLLNQIIIEQDKNDPGEILSLLNKGVKSVFSRKGEQEAEDGMDMALCVIDLQNNQLEFSGAQNPLLLIRKGELIYTKGDKTPIGGDTEMSYNFTNHKTDLQKGDIIYIFSDGYQDQFGGPQNKKFMIKRFKELLLSIQNQPMEEQKEQLNKALEEWKENEEQVDDILVIGIRI